MSLNENKSMSLKTVLMIGGAYASYTIGSGFATGQEVLQFFGSWGHPLLTVLISAVLTVAFCYCVFDTGRTQEFKNPSECYRYYCGKYVGYFFDYFSLILVFGVLISMFAGCGATLNQYFGIPTYVGAIGMGVLSAFVVLLGLKSVEKVLGVVGVIIIVYVIGIGIAALAMKGGDFATATANLPTYVENGQVLQAGVFGIYSPILSPICYAGICLITGCVFFTSLGKNIKSEKENVTSGIFSGIFFHAGVLLVLAAILLNLDGIVASGAQVPNLAAIDLMIPSIGWTFAIILVLGIFSTVTGYLWLVGGRFAEEKTTRHRVIVIALVVAGVFGGAIIPFNMIINILYPFAGLVGAILMVFIFVKTIRTKSAAKKNKAIAE